MKKILVCVLTCIVSAVTCRVAFAEALPALYIKAINPGYKVDSTQNVGEFIELARSDIDNSIPFSLANYSIGYTNSSGTATTLLSFADDDQLVGESILLRLASSPDSELANLTYSKTLALKAGPLLILYNDEIIDSICWNSSADCYLAFDSKAPTTLVRNLDLGIFEHLEEYTPIFSPDALNKVDSESKLKQCENLIFSEIFTYYESSKSEQFIEFYNPTAEQIPLYGCQIRYKNKLHDLSGIVAPDSYFAYYPEFSLTKDPSSYNIVELIDVDDSVVDALTYFSGQLKGVSYAQIGYDSSGAEIWKLTYDKTPGMPNVFQEYKTCEEGKTINPDTGNCVKITTETTKECGAGKYLNPETGRCKSYETEEEKTCAEGYYLNPDTNRCKKIKENSGAEYELENANYAQESSFVAIYAIAIILALAALYLVYQFRYEIKRFFGKVFRRFPQKPHP